MKRTSILVFGAGLVAKEILTAWFLYTAGVFHLATGAQIAVSAAAGLALAAGMLAAVQFTTAGHNDPDTPWVFWVRLIVWAALTTVTAVFLIAVPLAGSPMVALYALTVWTAVARYRAERATTETEHADRQARHTARATRPAPRYRRSETDSPRTRTAPNPAGAPR